MGSTVVRATLNGYVSTIMEKTSFDHDRFATEVRRAGRGRKQWV